MKIFTIFIALFIFFHNKTLMASSLFDAHFSKGIINFSNEDYDNAIKEFESAIEDIPGDINALYYLGISHIKLGDYEKSIEYLNNVINKEPKYYRAHFDLGVANFKLGKYEKSKEEFLNIIDLVPESDIAISARKYLKAIKDIEHMKLKWKLNIGSSFQYDTNVKLEAEDFASDEKDSREIINIKGELKYPIYKKMLIDMGFYGYQSFHNALKEYNLSNLSTKIQIANEYRNFSVKDFDIPYQASLEYKLDYSILDSEDYSVFNIGKLGLRLIEGQSGLTDIFYQLSDNDFKRDEDEGRDAYLQDTGIYQYLFFSADKKFIKIGFEYENNGAESNDYDYLGYRYLVGLFLPIFLKTGLQFEVGENQRNYFHHSIDREDKISQFSFTLFRDFGKHFSISLSTIVTNNQADVMTGATNIYEYKRSIYSISLSGKF